MTAPDLERSKSVARPREDVLPLAEALRDRLAEHCQRAEIAGSLRRGKPHVNDVDLVVCEPTPGFYAYLDELVGGGKVQKARYGEAQRTAWGMKRRGLEYDGTKFEVYVADADNWGYQFWLRTGPGDANTTVMTILKQRESAFRLAEGYGAVNGVQVPIRDEQVLFALLGMPYIDPAKRDIALYRRLMEQRHTAPHTMFGEAWMTRSQFLAGLSGGQLDYFAGRARLFVREYPASILAALAPVEEHVEWRERAQSGLIAAAILRLRRMREEAELILQKVGE